MRCWIHRVMRWPEFHWAKAEIHGISRGGSILFEFLDPEGAGIIELMGATVDFGNGGGRSTFSVLGYQCVSAGSMPSQFEHVLMWVSKTKPRNMRSIISSSHADEPWTGSVELRPSRPAASSD